MVTGQVPFDGDSTVSVAIKHLQEEITPPSELAEDLPYSLEQIILKCTQKNSERRYPNTEELIKDLKRSLVDPDGDFVVIPPLGNADTVIITDEANSKARMLTLWFFAQAEKVLGDIMDCDSRSREMEQKLKRIFEIIRDQDRGDGVLTSTISHCASGSGTTSSDRCKLLAELIERGWISQENNRFMVLNPPPGMGKTKLRKK